MTKKLLENYLKTLHEQDEPFPEGSLMNKLFVALGFGLPRHRKFKMYLKQYGKCVETCNKHYEEEKQVYKQDKDLYNQMDNPDKMDKRDVKETEKMNSEMIKNNPEKAKCITHCRITLLRSIIKLVEQEGDKICEKNIGTNTCKEWLNKNLPELKVELEYLEGTIEKLDRTSDPRKLQRILGKINSNMISGR